MRERVVKFQFEKEKKERVWLQARNLRRARRWPWIKERRLCGEALLATLRKENCIETQGCDC